MNRILVPLDGSLQAEEALPTAVSLARVHHATIDLLLVNEARLGDGLEGWPWAISTAGAHGDFIANRAERLREGSGCPVEYSVAEGRVGEEICRHAQATDADLIVMASRGRTGFARILGGSVADTVIRHARIPVLLLRAHPAGRHIRRSALRIERILVAVDGSAESLAALDAALALADPGVTELHLIEAVAPVALSPLNVVRRVTRVDRLATQHAVDRVNAHVVAVAAAAEARTGWDIYSHIIVDDDPAHGILRVAHGFNASIVAMGTHGRGTSRMFLGSVAEQVLGDGRYPMLIVRPPDSTADERQLSEETCVQHPHP